MHPEDDDEEVSFEDRTVVLRQPMRPSSPAAAAPQPASITDGPDAWNERTAALSPAQHSLEGSKPALPFRAEPPTPEPADESVAEWESRTEMLSPALQAELGTTPALPFQPAPSAAATPPPLGNPPPFALPFAAPAPLSFGMPFVAPTPVEPAPEARPAPYGLPADDLPAAEAPLLGREGFPILHDPTIAVGTIPWFSQGVRAKRTILVKATCDLNPRGTTTLRAAPEPLQGDVHHDGDPRKSLAYASDLEVQKPRVDVTLVGHAHADRGPVEASVVSLAFGDPRAGGFERKIAVFGERRFERMMGVETGPGKPLLWRKVPLVYELAFGGDGFPDNPVGIGRDGRVAPQLDDPDRPVKSPRDKLPPACFGPLGPAARSKAVKGPESDGAENQAAPAAQQITSARGDEAFVITGVHPDFGVLQGRLPGLRPRGFVERKYELEEVAFSLDTVAFDTDAMKVNLVFRGVIDVVNESASDVDGLFVTLEPMQGASLSKLDIEELYRHRKAAARRAPAAAMGAHVAALDPKPEGALEPARADARRLEVLEKLETGVSLVGLDLAGTDLSGLDLSRQTLVGTNLRGALLRGAKLEGADLTEARLVGAVLAGARAAGASLARADLTGAVLDGADLTGALLGEADLSNARCERTIFRGASGPDARFSGATLRGAVFERAELPNADFVGAVLDGASFQSAKIPEARLYEASGARARFDDAEMPGARLEGARLAGASFARTGAAGSTWDGAELTDARFVSTNLEGASLARVAGERVVFEGANLSRAILRKARLRDASFVAADLTRASLESADLTGANLTGAKLHGAETWKTQIDRAALARGMAGPRKPEGPAR